ncbi:MATE family efflux transporter [candidate division KSB1 bacterium]|nr:MATE family efflux transporter [candidate division KSB1 bacterium]RQW04318.1 MAG: MATE family efflux transporter [candidate division KSB1 bacterium]
MSEKTFIPSADPPLDWHSSPEAANLLPHPAEEPELTRIPLSRAIFKLAGPAIGSMLFIMLFGLVDAWWVGKLGAGPLAGVSAASFVLWALQSIAVLVETGVNAMVARFVGAGERRLAGLVIGQAILLASAIALLTSGLGLALQRSIFRLMGLEDVVMHTALDYMTITLYGLIAIFLAFAVDAAFRGAGDTRTPLKIISVGLTLNMIIDPLFIFGIGPFPRLEAAGAALATVLAHAVIVLWSLYLLRRRDIGITFRDERSRLLNLGIMWRLCKIGAPIATSGFLFSLSYMILSRFITEFGYGPLAALGLGHRIEGLSYYVAVGFSFAASILVGQNLGAHKPERAEKAVWLSVAYISIFLFFVSLVYFFFGAAIVRFFIDDPQAIKEGASYLRIIAIFEIFLGFEIVLEGAFSGAGNSLPPMLISVPLTWLRIPLALLFAHGLGMGSLGIWLAISVTTGLKGIVMAFWFRRGRWKLQAV